MTLGPQPIDSVVTKQAERKLVRDKLLKVRLNPQEALLVNSVIEKGNFPNVATAVRWLFQNYSQLSEAERLVALFKKWRELESELNKL